MEEGATIISSIVAIVHVFIALNIRGSIETLKRKEGEQAERWHRSQKELADALTNYRLEALKVEQLKKRLRQLSAKNRNSLR